MAEGIGGFPIPNRWPDDRDEKTLRLRLGQMNSDPGTQPWLLRAMIQRVGSRTMVGHIGFHGRPQERAAELGYTVFPEYRRRGYAMEAAEAMMDWAAREEDVHRFRVSISPGNEPSIAMAAKMGFVKVGEQMDEEDGLEHVFELSL